MWKTICNLGDPISLRHPVAIAAARVYIHVVNERWFGGGKRERERETETGKITRIDTLREEETDT